MRLGRFFRVVAHSLAICIATLCILALYAAATTHGAKVSPTACATDTRLRGPRIPSSQPQIAHVREIQYKRRIARLQKRVKHFEVQPVPFAITEEEAREQIIRKLMREQEIQGSELSEPYFAGNQRVLCDRGMSDSERESFKAIIRTHSSYTRSLRIDTEQKQEEEPIHQDLQAIVGRDRYLEIVETCGKIDDDPFKKMESFETSSQIAMLNLSPQQVARMKTLRKEYSDFFGQVPEESDSNTQSDWLASQHLDETGHLPTPEPAPSIEPENVLEPGDEANRRLAEAAAEFASVLTPEQLELIKKYSADGAWDHYWTMNEIPIPGDVGDAWQESIQ